MYYAPLGARARNRNLERFSTTDLKQFDGVLGDFTSGLTIVDDTSPEKSRKLMLGAQGMTELEKSFPEVHRLFRHMSRVETVAPDSTFVVYEPYRDEYSGEEHSERFRKLAAELRELARAERIQNMKRHIGEYGLRGVHEDVNITVGATRKSRDMPGGLDVFVAPLAGVAIVEQTAYRAEIEPVILGPENTPGLFPAGLKVLQGIVDPVLYSTQQQS